ncbi:helix-turn-helix domain-containing protein [Xenorhabdus bovienii]|uniref:transcriptional regulator n=1 Tax=Xenorhabdus bovienii TaxID=40576 RepID=UPI0023B25636|nr:helix-turn-helix domain-containing protein [Xenorhabdus bovienii]MDE9447581.1 helix-turn-helix domain-containing protein [Xenorhabdus bovienii]MDE9496029.1 helix-turn-helix domain-containing protein [Xenorhabdus bovienii]MDE9504434.1 helix-turn-helix domain-containing protein [Xenorhabdus bovienii]MDE9528151.1 helix-turn-helix domain-containing protein [Xenorhabdus bovienii]MDE9571271.1 helix-turn-helix domain-containing protein [Xenorhabdus bovienii]
MINTAIEKAIKLWGSQKRFAEHIGKAQSTVSDWLTGKKRISPENVVIIVEATNGAVQAHELRPDLPKVFPPPADHDHVS